MAAVFSKIRNNWFVPVLAVLAVSAWLIIRTVDTQDVQQLELALLIDIFITIPLLFVLCYRRRLSRAALALRVLALQCSGLLLASWLIPLDQQNLLLAIAPYRWLGIALLVAFEMAIMASVVKMAFKKETKVADLATKGMPEWIARLMLLEAKFWRWLFGYFRK
jgi:hypothetical protein